MTKQSDGGKELCDLYNKIFEYKDGELYWKEKVSHKVVIGKIAGDIVNGRRRVRFNKKTSLVHRVVFCMHNGYLPNLIDHVDGNPLNNRIENLREATHCQNSMNSKKPITNTSGCKHVSWKKDRQKYKVEMAVNKKVMFFGYYEDLELADLVANEARAKYHKEFAKHE